MSAENEQFFSLVTAILLFGLAVTIFTVFFRNPYRNFQSKPVFSNQSSQNVSITSLSLFYSGVFLICFALFSAVLFWLKVKRKRSSDRYLLALTSLRQASLLALFVICLLIFQSWRILVWWDALLLALALLLIEFYFFLK